ncbi:AraC family transcriptional regulator [Celeribacter halophilus]|uniref:AraC-type DNA-binding protein n=1 Tax=Celeribacter halophilus TaxID=576117 RepID=A0A1I3NPC1_9RHOB|nr:AraC family transcriptional regulator [Celeribacter halophilus]PZX14575.1 AraC-like DNA-binding protein [Celeribacter halophilus]SFJ10626.1 AraC-type DNA-binding protein [Celeribacter halophilus]
MKAPPFLDVTTSKIRQAHELQVQNWDELSEWASGNITSVSMTPLGHTELPNGIFHSMRVGRIGISRSMYGKATLVSGEECFGAPVIVSTNIRGHSIPELQGKEDLVNGPDMSFVSDLSQGSHRTQLSEDNVQMQLAIDPKLLNEVGRNWFGNIHENKTWQTKTRFGGRGTRWYACLTYIMRLIAETSHPLSNRNIQHIEETLCANLLENWAAQSGINLSEENNIIVPRIIRMAEEYIIEHAADAPTLAEIAQNVDISVRNLTMNFKKFRGCTPGQFLREQRLQAARSEFLSSDQEHTVSQIAASLGYIHMGEFAKAYRKRFGEKPSETLKRTIW